MMTRQEQVPEGPVRILGRGYWAEDIAWWAGSVVIWPLWLGVWLLVAAFAYVGASSFLGLLQATAYAEVITAAVAAVLISAIACILLSGRLAGWLAWRDMPGRLWVVPAAYGAIALVLFVVAALVSLLQGAPGPLPWSRETTVGLFFLAGFALVPALAAWTFRRGSRAAFARRDRPLSAVPGSAGTR